MILQAYGSEEGKKFCKTLIENTNYLCSELNSLGVAFYRNPFMNIIAIKFDVRLKSVAENYHLVEDDHKNPKWWRIVVMQHSTKEMINQFLNDIKNAK